MTVATAAAATTVPSLWAGLLRHWAGSRPVAAAPDRDPAVTRSEAVTHLRERIRQYERSQPSYADDLRAALAQLERTDRAA